MSGRPDILTDPFPEELNPELFRSHIDWEEEERILAEQEKQERREELKSFFKGRDTRFKEV